jgi:hypothetical protein
MCSWPQPPLLAIFFRCLWQHGTLDNSAGSRPSVPKWDIGSYLATINRIHALWQELVAAIPK